MGDSIGRGRQQQSNGRGSDGAGVGRPGGSKSSLAKQAAVLSGWPTTSCSNDRAARPAIMKREDGTKNQQRLQDLAALSGWPTPTRSTKGTRRRTTGCTQSSGQTANCRTMRRHNTAYPTNGFWRDADWLGCRDGKFRPVEPGTSPLVNGAAARVGRLRGYGNAIVAQVAQTFIEATQGW